MAITEEERHELYLGLEKAIGRRRATTLMEHLPPVGWSDVATKRDIDHLATQLRGEMSEFAAGVYRRMNTWGISLVMAHAATSALIINVLR